MKALNELGRHIIKPHFTDEVHPYIVRNNRNLPWFGQCVGAMNNTMMDAVVLASVPEAYRNRYGRVAQNVMCICNFDMKLIFVYSGWEGTVHDARIYLHAASQGSAQFPWLPEGKYYLADSAFLCTRGI
ncbi:uncharacterized protein LOC108985163 [Juglans regia]|uniref:Uncharacterized protein LOC108985163 n=1 Tax=Juglans regia TaxID=51240 RepID=A0A2I4E0H0_JUGRE|nr:uncharacterized protein LOC108985163 [Juglans regia]